MNKLVAFGCSHVYGNGLNDCWDIENNTLGSSSASNIGWPARLAKHLNLEFDNQGSPGSCNRSIWHNIINYNWQPNDIAVIMWTHISRRVFFDSPIEKYKHRISSWTDTNFSRNYIENYSFEHDDLLDLYQNVNATNAVLDHVGITRYNLIYNEEWITDFNWNVVEFLPKYFRRYKRFGKLAHDNQHHGQEANDKFADDIFAIIRHN